MGTLGCTTMAGGADGGAGGMGGAGAGGAGGAGGAIGAVEARGDGFAAADCGREGIPPPNKASARP